MFSAAMTPTALSMAVQECVECALSDCALSLKAAALDMDVPLSVLSEGLKGEKHLSLQRLSKLGPVFLMQFCKRLMAQLGGVALSSEERTLLLGAAMLGRKHMAKMGTVTVTLPLSKEHAS